ncbi:MAG: head protein [Pleurocapsa sp. SU_196_0]|nr:head protein [Pleurocapsa sp. SU_196_0]
MDLNADNLNTFFRNFRALSAEGIGTAKPRWNQVAMEVPSTGSQNDYGWLQDLPGMREWIGEREIKNLASASYTIVNKDFEVTVSVKRNDIEDDQIGVYAPMFRALGENVAYSPDEIVFGLLPLGFTAKGYDKKPFFSDAHPVGKGTFSNSGKKKLSETAFEAALATMQGQKKSNGQPANVFMGTDDQAPLLVVGPTNRATAQKIVGSKTVNGGDDNPNYGAARILVLPELSGSNEDMWFLLDVSRQVRPLILQRRKQPTFVRKDAATDENVFNRNVLVYGYDDRKNAGYGLWQLAFGSEGTDP